MNETNVGKTLEGTLVNTINTGRDFFNYETQSEQFITDYIQPLFNLDFGEFQNNLKVADYFKNAEHDVAEVLKTPRFRDITLRMYLNHKFFDVTHKKNETEIYESIMTRDIILLKDILRDVASFYSQKKPPFSEQSERKIHNAAWRLYHKTIDLFDAKVNDLVQNLLNNQREITYPEFCEKFKEKIPLECGS